MPVAMNARLDIDFFILVTPICPSNNDGALIYLSRKINKGFLSCWQDKNGITMLKSHRHTFKAKEIRWVSQATAA